MEECGIPPQLEGVVATPMKISNLCNISKSRAREESRKKKAGWGGRERLRRKTYRKANEKEEKEKKNTKKKKTTLVTNFSPAFGKKCRNRPTGKKRKANQSNKIHLS